MLACEACCAGQIRARLQIIPSGLLTNAGWGRRIGGARVFLPDSLSPRTPLNRLDRTITKEEK